MDPRHPRQNSYPRHPRQNFIEPRNPRDPRKFLTHATHAPTAPTQPTSPRNPRNLADSFWEGVNYDNSVLLVVISPCNNLSIKILNDKINIISLAIIALSVNDT